MSIELSSPARSYISLLRERLARREDSEHVQALIRIGFGLFISITGARAYGNPGASGRTARGMADRVLAREVAAGARLIRWLEDDDPRGAAVSALSSTWARRPTSC